MRLCCIADWQIIGMKRGGVTAIWNYKALIERSAQLFNVLWTNQMNAALRIGWKESSLG